MAGLPHSGSLTLLRPSQEGSYSELIADPGSGAVQFGRFAFRLRQVSRGVEGLLGYRRSFEFDETNGTGQDFALLRGDEQHTVGVLSDGVSQSFFGDVAARQVSMFLARYLWNARLAPPSKNELEQELKRLETEAAMIVTNHAIPEGVPPMVHEALEKKKHSGSQSVFAAFLLDNLRQNIKVYLCGDVRVVVCAAGQQPLSIRADPDGRWSSAGASDMRLKCESHSKIEAVILASDGVRDNWNREILGETNSSLQSSFQAMAQEQAAKDDVSFVSVRFLPGAQVAQVEARVQPEPQRAYVTWVDGADTVKPAGSPKPQIEDSCDQSSSSRRPPQREQSSMAVPGLKRKSRWVAAFISILVLVIFGLGLLVGIVVWPKVSSMLTKAWRRTAAAQAGPPIKMTTSLVAHFSVINEFDLMRDFIDDLRPPIGAATIEFISDTPDLHAKLTYVASGNRRSKVDVGPFKPGDHSYFAACKIDDLPKTKTEVTIDILDSADREVAKTLKGLVEEGYVYRVSIETARK